MKETIYTLPVSDAFDSPDPCAFCYLEKKLEDESTDYYLGSALMEPDHRKDTNENGFCGKHFEMLYNRQENRLGLGLIINTHINEHLGRIKDLYEKNKNNIYKESMENLSEKLSNKIKGKKSSTDSYIDNALEYFKNYSDNCAICAKEAHTLDRYLDVTFHLWDTESSFRTKFNNKNGFCLKHTDFILNGAKKYLKSNKKAEFVKIFMEKEILSIETLNNDVVWFTKKFDYRYQNDSWKNSKDAIPRAIEKLKGFCRFK